MKNTITRDTARVLKPNLFQPKPIQSQSPPHKKLMKKIEGAQTQQKNEYSLQDNLVRYEPKEEVKDFRVEIERRFQRSTANKTYKFPKSLLLNEESMITTDSEANISGESLKYVTVYDLASQNKKQKINGKHLTKVNCYMQRDEEQNHYQQHKYDIIKNEISNDVIVNYKKNEHNNDDDDGYNDGVVDENENDINDQDELEIQIRDKSSKAYKRLIELLEHQFNKANNQGNIQIKEINNRFEPLKMDNNINIKNNNNNMAQSQPHPGNYTHKSLNNKGDSNHNIRHANTNESKLIRYPSNIKDNSTLMKTSSSNNHHNLKKNASRERVRVNVESNSFADKSLTQNSHNSTRGNLTDQVKLSQDTIKKLHNPNFMKSITPKYLNSKINLLNPKDPLFKTYNPESYPGQFTNINPIHTKVQSNILYEKAKKEVINSKLKSSGGSKLIKYPSNTALHTNTQNTKRDESPSKEELKKIALSNLYSPVNDTEKILCGPLSSNKISKKSSVKALQMISPLKATQDRDTGSRSGIYNNNNQGIASTSSSSHQPCLSHGLSMPIGNSQEKFYSKPLFKLDLSKRLSNNRDALTSGRNRNKTTDMFNIDSLIRMSYDYQNQQQQQQQHSNASINSTQKNSSKKILFTNALKNLSLSKDYSMSKNVI